MLQHILSNYRKLSSPKSEPSKLKPCQLNAGHPLDICTRTVCPKVKLESTGFDRSGKERIIINTEYTSTVSQWQGQKGKHTSLISSHENPQNPRIKSRRSCGEVKV